MHAVCCNEYAVARIYIQDPVHAVSRICSISDKYMQENDSSPNSKALRLYSKKWLVKLVWNSKINSKIS